MPIDVEFAQIYIDSNTAPDAEPQFTEDEADAIFESALAVDADGVSPGGTGYTATYTYDSMNAAILQAWQIKLAKAVEMHEDDESKVFDHIQEMLTYWSSRVSGSVIGGAVSTSPGSMSVTNCPVW